MAEVYARIIIISGIFCFIINGLEGSIQSEGTVTTDSVCYSTTASHVLACPSNSYQIALTSFYYGFKGNSVGCANDGTATGSCCEYDSATDCREEASSETSYMDALSGRSGGTLATVTTAAATTCSALTFSAVSIFSELKYQCISDTRIFEMCTSVSYKSTDGSLVYLQNRGYDQGISILSSDTSCTCSVEVLSSSADTTLYTLHMDLQDDPSNCLQSVILSDGTSNVKTFDCVTAPFNTIQSESLTGGYFRVSFSNSKGTTAGKFWIGFQGSTSTPPIIVNCPAVSKIDCGSLPNPTHGTLTTTGTSFGSTATYSCLANYDVTSGDTSQTCQENRSWNGIAAVCSYNCGTLSNPANGFVTYVGTFRGDTVTYSCEPNYLLDGNIHRSCIDGSGWNGTVSYCVYDCRSLSNPVHGTVTFIGTTHGNTATFTCDQNYSLDGNVHRSCIDGSGWNGTVPYCLYDCGTLINQANGLVTFVGTYSGDTATYTCDSNYSLDGNMHRSCIDGSGWNGTVPNCLYECGSPSNPTNGAVSFTSTTAGSVATYTCNGDLVIVGSGTRSCEAGTGWIGSAPTCGVASHATARPSTDGSDDNTTIIIIVTVLWLPFFIAIIAHVVCYINHIKNDSITTQDPEATEASHPLPAVSTRDVSRPVLQLPRDRTSLPPIRGTASSTAVPRTESREHTTVSVVSASQIQSEIKVLHPSQHVHHPPHRTVESDLHHTSEFDSHCNDYNYHPHPELRAAESTNVQKEPKTRKKKRRK